MLSCEVVPYSAMNQMSKKPHVSRRNLESARRSQCCRRNLMCGIGGCRLLYRSLKYPAAWIPGTVACSCKLYLCTLSIWRQQLSEISSKESCCDEGCYDRAGPCSDQRATSEYLRL